MRRAEVIAAALAIGVAACASHPKGAIAPASVPCGYRAVTRKDFALAVPLYWEEDATKNGRASFPGETPLLVVEGGAGGVLVASRPWPDGSKAWTLEILRLLKDARFEVVEARPLPSAGEDALLVEDRRWDARRQTQWHDWRVLVAARGVGMEMLCRADEDDMRTLGQVCVSIAESFEVGP